MSCSDIHVQMKFWKFENCTFCEITSSNVLGFFFKPSEQTLFIQTILMRVKTLCSHQNYTCLKFGLNQKWNISLNFWVNIGMWPIVSVQLAMPDTTMMSEYMIYMVWKLIAMFCPITCVTSMWQFQKLVVTG